MLAAALLAPCFANRLARDQETIDLVDKSGATEDESASLFSADTIAALEEMAADEEEQTQQWCTAMSATSTRTFRFELVYPDGERTAMELERHPRDPMIRFHRGRTWSVRLLRTPDRDGNIEESLEWTPVVPNDVGGEPRLDENGQMIVDASTAEVVDVRKDLAYIKRTPPSGEIQAGIEFGYMSGTSEVFAGGLYYPENAMKRSLVRAYQQRREENVAELAADPSFNESNFELNTLNRHAHGREMTVGGARIALEGTTSMVDQIYQAGKFSALQAFAFSFFPLIGASPFAITAAWTATVAGLHTGVVYALPFIVPTAIVSAVHSWRHERRELSMTASEKIFEKFSCHRMIGVCQGAELVGRDAIRVFARRPDGDILIPFNGDVDVNTLEPLGRTVSWWTQVNNSGNIECTDERVVWGN